MVNWQQCHIQMFEMCVCFFCLFFNIKHTVYIVVVVVVVVGHIHIAQYAVSNTVVFVFIHNLGNAT